MFLKKGVLVAAGLRVAGFRVLFRRVLGVC